MQQQENTNRYDRHDDHGREQSVHDESEHKRNLLPQRPRSHAVSSASYNSAERGAWLISRLLNVPEGHVGGKRNEAADIGAAGDRRRPLAEQCHRYIIPGVLLQLPSNRLALLERGGKLPIVTQLLLQIVLGPAQPPPFATACLRTTTQRNVPYIARSPP